MDVVPLQPVVPIAGTVSLAAMMPHTNLSSHSHPALGRRVAATGDYSLQEDVVVVCLGLVLPQLPRSAHLPLLSLYPVPLPVHHLLQVALSLGLVAHPVGIARTAVTIARNSRSSRSHRAPASHVAATGGWNHLEDVDAGIKAELALAHRL